jgi:hypothetical protein
MTFEPKIDYESIDLKVEPIKSVIERNIEILKNNPDIGGYLYTDGYNMWAFEKEVSQKRADELGVTLMTDTPFLFATWKEKNITKQHTEGKLMTFERTFDAVVNGREYPDLNVALTYGGGDEWQIEITDRVPLQDIDALITAAQNHFDFYELEREYVEQLDDEREWFG